MTCKVRPHGTHVKYVIERCRCDACRLAANAYGLQLRRENAERAWGVRPSILIDAADTREYILLLRKAGMGQLQIEKLSGVGHTAQWKITSGRVRRVHRETEDAIMSVAVDDHVFLRSYVDAAPAKAIISDLLKGGMTKTAVARSLGARSRSLQVARSHRCTLRTLLALGVVRELVGRQQVVTP